jgi:hypothetical protein
MEAFDELLAQPILGLLDRLGGSVEIDKGSAS